MVQGLVTKLDLVGWWMADIGGAVQPDTEELEEYARAPV